MGLSELEVRILSRQAGADEILAVLLDPTQRGRGELYFPTTVERNDGAEMDRPDSGRLSIKRQSSSGHHPYQAATEDGRLSSTIPEHGGTAGARGKAGATVVSITAEPEGGCCVAGRISARLAAGGSVGFRVSPRFMVHRWSLRSTQEKQPGVVCGRDRRASHAGCDHG